MTYGTESLARRAWAVVDTAAIEQNTRLLRAQLGDTQLLGVVKANAYGHGVVEA
ncbi:MAG: alanine racemase, partial [Roseiflexaceae bacterium]|nr:alanine racemase [Roseiflexaceae bacterium]